MKYRYAQRRNEGRGRFSEKKEEESTVKHSNLSVSVRGVAQPDVSDGPLRKSCQVNDKAKRHKDASYATGHRQGWQADVECRSM